MATEFSLQIVSGFSREDLRDTFRKDQRGERIPVVITVRVPADMVEGLVHFLPLTDLKVESYNKIDLRVVLNTVTWEDGSGNSWILKGYIQKPGIKTVFSAYYNTSDRRGMLKIEV